LQSEFTIPLNKFITLVSPFITNESAIILDSLGVTFLSSETLKRLNYTIVSFDKTARILEIQTPIESRKIKVTDFSKKDEIQKDFFKTSPVNGSISFQTRYSHLTANNETPDLDSLDMLSSMMINYGHNIFNINMEVNDMENFEMQSFTVERKVSKTLDIKLGDVNYVSLLQNTLSSQATLWGANLDIRSDRSKRTGVADYTIFLQQNSLVKIIINNDVFSSFYLSAGNHVLRDIPKFDGKNNLKIIAEYTESKKTYEDVLVEKSFFYDPNSVSKGWWDLDFQFGYPKHTIFNKNSEKMNYYYDPSEDHLGINFSYMYTSNLRVLHLLKYGQNYSVAGLKFNYPFQFGVFDSSFGVANEYGEDNFVIQNSFTVHNIFKSPLYLSSIYSPLNKNFLISKNLSFSDSINISLGYRITTIDSALSIVSQYKKESLTLSHEFQKGLNILSNKLNFNFYSAGWISNFSVFSSTTTPLTFYYGLTKLFSNGIELQKTTNRSSLIWNNNSDKDFYQRFLMNIGDTNDLSYDLTYDNYKIGTRFLNKHSTIIRNDYLNYQNNNYQLRFAYKENFNNKDYIQKESHFFINTGLVFVGKKAAVYQGGLKSFAIISAKDNLKGTKFFANKKQADMFGNVVLPLSGQTTVVTSAPEANPWMDLGNTTFELNPSEFSGYHLEIGGIGTHAIMIILQDSEGNPLVDEKITIAPIKPIVEIPEKEFIVGFGGRLVALGLVLGHYEIRFDNPDYAPLRFKIREMDDNLVRFGIVNTGSFPRFIFTRTKEDEEKSRKDLLDRLYKTNDTSNDEESDSLKDTLDLNSETSEDVLSDSVENLSDDNDSDSEQDSEQDSDNSVETSTEIIDDDSTDTTQDNSTDNQTNDDTALDSTESLESNDGEETDE